MINAPKGVVYEDKDLKMEGLFPSPRLFNELMKAWSGFALTWEKANEGFDELERSPRLVNPKSCVCLSKTT